MSISIQHRKSKSELLSTFLSHLSVVQSDYFICLGSLFTQYFSMFMDNFVMPLEHSHVYDNQHTKFVFFPDKTYFNIFAQ